MAELSLVEDKYHWKFLECGIFEGLRIELEWASFVWWIHRMRDNSDTDFFNSGQKMHCEMHAMLSGVCSMLFYLQKIYYACTVRTIIDVFSIFNFRNRVFRLNLKNVTLSSCEVSEALIRHFVITFESIYYYFQNNAVVTSRFRLLEIVYADRECDQIWKELLFLMLNNFDDLSSASRNGRSPCLQHRSRYSVIVISVTLTQRFS